MAVTKTKTEKTVNIGKTRQFSGAKFRSSNSAGFELVPVSDPAQRSSGNFAHIVTSSGNVWNAAGITELRDFLNQVIAQIGEASGS